MNAPLPAIATRVAAVSPAPVVYLHFALFLADGRTLGDETFRLVNFQGKETVSEPFEFQLELHGNTSGSEGVALKFDDVVGRLSAPDDTTMRLRPSFAGLRVC